MAFSSVINFIPILATVAGWIRKLLSYKITGFILLKALLFFLCFRYFPYFFGRAYQWIANLGASSTSGFDLSFLNGLLNPQFTGLTGWFFTSLKLDTCLNILVSGAMVRLSIKRLPFMPG